MEKIPTNFSMWTPVVALALFDHEGRILLQQRPLAKHHGGLWEFPGGKVEYGEKPRAALVREIAEELAIALDPDELNPGGLAEEDARSAAGSGAGATIVLLLYTSHQPVTDVAPCEGQAWGWFSREAAKALELAPMDRHLLTQLPL